MEKTLIVHHSLKRKQYFFSTDHCQGVKLKGNKVVRKSIIPKDFVPVTYCLPNSVVPRPELPDGIVRTKEDYVKIFCEGETEVLNPESEY